MTPMLYDYMGIGSTHNVPVGASCGAHYNKLPDMPYTFYLYSEDFYNKNKKTIEHLLAEFTHSTIKTPEGTFILIERTRI